LLSGAYVLEKQNTCNMSKELSNLLKVQEIAAPDGCLVGLFTNKSTTRCFFCGGVGGKKFDLSGPRLAERHRAVTK
jgi:hypothetical protein